MSWTAPKTWTTGLPISKAELDEQVRDNENFLKVNIALEAAVELTIASGAVTKSQSNHTIDTQGDAATDDLDTINAGAEGELLLIRAASGARTVIVKHDVDNIWCPAGVDLYLDDAQDTLLLQHNGTYWVVIGGEAGGIENFLIPQGFLINNDLLEVWDVGSKWISNTTKFIVWDTSDNTVRLRETPY